MSKTTVSKKGLTTIPSKIREVLGIKSGDKLEWRIVKKNGKTLIEVEAEKNPYEFLKGRRKDPKGTFDRVEDLADALLVKRGKMY
ncbi:MAG: AbrB/MazE/SpoVT family DNA-binding domain-containing protein [Candidatus Hydrothermarchaeales archaeon]